MGRCVLTPGAVPRSAPSTRSSLPMRKSTESGATSPESRLWPLFSFPLLLHELREGLRDRRLVRQDVEHPAPLERTTDDLFVELGRDLHATVGDSVVVRRWGCQAFDASFGRGARRGREDGERGIRTGAPTADLQTIMHIPY